MCDVGGTELAFFVGGVCALATTALAAGAVGPPRAGRLRVRTEPAAEQLAA
jgi:hypothetical protein